MTKSAEYRPRIYRDLMGNDRWITFRSQYLESDLWIAVSRARFNSNVEKYSYGRTIFYRHMLDEHIRLFPDFRSSLSPLYCSIDVPPLIDEMYSCSRRAGTGPMSAVAGAIAEHICNDLINEFGFEEAVVENGGDIFMRLASPSTISVYAGSSPLSDRIGLTIKPGETPVSVCCSSGTIGHSLSFGNADACVVACRSGALADAYATACCNEVKNAEMVQPVTEKFMALPGILSVIIIKDDKVAIGGSLEVTVLQV